MLKATVTQGKLLEALSAAQGVVDKRETIPVLAAALIEAKGDHLTICATDQEVGLRSKCNAAAITAGKVAVSARTLFEIVRELPSGDIELEERSGGLDIVAGKGKFRLPACDPKEFPEMPSAVDGAESKSVDAAGLLEALDLTAFAMSKDETRISLCGLRFDKESVVATDGHRLAKVGIPYGFERPWTMPSKAVATLRKLLDGTEGDVELIADGGPVAFCGSRSGSWELSMRLIEAEYVDYHQVIPKGRKTSAAIEVGVFLAALRRSMIIGANPTKLTLRPGGIRIESAAQDTGDGCEDIGADYDGPKVVVGANGRYLADALATLPTESNVSLSVEDDVSPILMRRYIPDNYEYVVMPVRL